VQYDLRAPETGVVIVIDADALEHEDV